MEQATTNLPLLQLQDLCKFYTGASVVMGLNHVNLSFYAGEFVAITGESGSGKSTLAHILSGILPYESGEMILRGMPTSHFDSADWERYRRENISFISQNYGILPGATVLANVVSALRLSGMDKPAAKSRAEELLRLVELWDLRHRRAGKMSSGQKQRLSIARALAKPAPILIADEPTGNLDPENSAKVIQLLSQAAQERLVILITHDFYEAAHCATRRIQLQDSRIVLDTPLNPAADVPASAPIPAKRRILSPYIAGLQLKARPVWAGLMLLFFALSAFAVFAFLGTFLVNLDDTSTRIYDRSAFYNGDKTRIVVQRSDAAPFTQEDLDTLLSIEHTQSLEPHGYVTDIQYANRLNVDYAQHFTFQGDSDTGHTVLDYVELYDQMRFMRTIPLLPGNREFLSEGRLPETVNEIVAAESEGLTIGETITVYLHDSKNCNIVSHVSLDLTVVGLTTEGEGLYFSDDLGRAFDSFTLTGRSNLLLPWYDELTLPVTGVENTYTSRTLADDECLLSASRYNYLLSHSASKQSKSGKSFPAYLPDAQQYLSAENSEVPFAELNAIGSHGNRYDYLVLVSPDTFNQLTYSGNSNQVSLFLENYAYTDPVLTELTALGYTAISPFQQCSTEKNATLVQERMQTLLVCLLTLCAVVVLQTLVTRELFGIQSDSYKLLADQGLGRRTAIHSLCWQLLLFALAGQVLGFGCIQLCAQLNIERVQAIVRYLRLPQWLALSAVHLAVTALSLTFVSRQLSRRVFPAASGEMDLNLEEVAL